MRTRRNEEDPKKKCIERNKKKKKQHGREAVGRRDDTTLERLKFEYDCNSVAHSRYKHTCNREERNKALDFAKLPKQAFDASAVSPRSYNVFIFIELKRNVRLSASKVPRHFVRWKTATFLTVNQQPRRRECIFGRQQCTSYTILLIKRKPPSGAPRICVSLSYGLASRAAPWIGKTTTSNCTQNRRDALFLSTPPPPRVSSLPPQADIVARPPLAVPCPFFLQYQTVSSNFERNVSRRPSQAAFHLFFGGESSPWRSNSLLEIVFADKK